MSRFLIALGWLAVAIGLTMPNIWPALNNISMLVLMGVGLIVVTIDTPARAVLRQPAVGLLLAAGGGLLIALVATAHSAIDVVAILILAPLWFSFTLTALFRRLGERLTLTVIGFFALAGAGVGACVTIFDVFVLGLPRGGWTANNPIHLADLTLMLGFAAPIALYGTSRWRGLALLGPAVALVAVTLSGSRGPLLALIVMSAVALPWLLFSLWRGRRVVPWLAVFAVMMGLAASPFIEFNLGQRTFSIGKLADQLSTGDLTDNSTLERYFMLQTAWNAFWASPIYGHGAIEYTTKAARYAPPENTFAPSGHLHNDIANLAVIGGTLGLISYGLILAAPLIGALTAKAKKRAPLIFLALMMSVGYFAMGLTNAMFGVLTQTVLYGVLLALLMHLAGRDEDVGPGSAA